MNKEIWKPINGYEGKYEVSNIGNVRSIGFTDRLGHYRPFTLMKSFNSHRYKRICLSNDGLQIKYQVHRLVATAFVDNPLSLPQVNHKNGIRWDNRAENLEWVTCSQNITHAFEKLGKKGNPSWRGKVTAIAIPILQLSVDGFILSHFESKKKASKGLGVCLPTLNKIIKNKEKFNNSFLI